MSAAALAAWLLAASSRLAVAVRIATSEATEAGTTVTVGGSLLQPTDGSATLRGAEDSVDLGVFSADKGAALQRQFAKSSSAMEVRRANNAAVIGLSPRIRAAAAMGARWRAGSTLGAPAVAAVAPPDLAGASSSRPARRWQAGVSGAGSGFRRFDVGGVNGVRMGEWVPIEIAGGMRWQAVYHNFQAIQQVVETTGSTPRDIHDACMAALRLAPWAMKPYRGRTPELSIHIDGAIEFLESMCGYIIHRAGDEDFDNPDAGDVLFDSRSSVQRAIRHLVGLWDGLVAADNLDRLKAYLAKKGVSIDTKMWETLRTCFTHVAEHPQYREEAWGALRPVLTAFRHEEAGRLRLSAETWRELIQNAHIELSILFAHVDGR